MCEARRGSIINISSIAGLKGTANTIAYTASKWAVRGMTKTAANEYAGFGVRVNSVHPGIIDTPMADEFKDLGVMDMVRQAIPMGTETGPETVAKLVLFLASDDSHYSTGSEFVVDGGMVAR
jgi:3alpha(or 20beta)-hydroxysteroid dehydrogenase